MAPEGGIGEQATSEPPAPHPALVQHAQERAALVQNRIADRITALRGLDASSSISTSRCSRSGSIAIEESPWPTLTLIVSLEAIFLSTFVMISQNRADEKRQVVAAQEWKSVQIEEQQNEELLRLSSRSWSAPMRSTS